MKIRIWKPSCYAANSISGLCGWILKAEVKVGRHAELQLPGFKGTAFAHKHTISEPMPKASHQWRHSEISLHPDTLPKSLCAALILSQIFCKHAFLQWSGRPLSVKLRDIFQWKRVMSTLNGGVITWIWNNAADAWNKMQGLIGQKKTEVW